MVDFLQPEPLNAISAAQRNRKLTVKILMAGTGAARTESTSEIENKSAMIYTNPTMPTMPTPPKTAIGASRPAS